MCVITFGLQQPSVTPQSILLSAATQHGQVLDAALHIRTVCDLLVTMVIRMALKHCMC